MPTKTSNSKSAWSAKDIYDMIFSTYGNAHVNANKARAKEASKYMIPYIPEKEIMLTTGRYNTGKISTNLLDSIYNASQRTGVPLDIALGLAGRESTLGIGRGFKKGKSVSGTDLYSNWQQIQTIPNNKAQMKKWNSLLGRTDLTDEDYDFKSEFLIRAQDSLENTKPLDENPIDNALKFYQTGKYNPGDSKHTQMVEDDAKVLMSDPSIQKWLKTKNNGQMKCGGRRKAQLGLDIREGGIAIPIANNMFYINGRKHAAGGVAIGPNNKNGVEVEGGEVVEMIDSNHPSVGRQFKAGGQQQTMRVFSSVPFLRGVSPAQLVLEGANPDTVFKAQEEFKDRNRINDDGTRYEVGGEKRIYTPSKSIQRQIQETGKITIGGSPTIGGLRTFGYLRGLTTARKYGAKGSLIFRAGKELIKRGTQKLVDNGKITKEVAQIPRSIYGQFVGAYGQNLPKTIGLINNNMEQKKAGGIYIKPSKRGTFTAAATKHGMDVQEFASKVLNNKEDYSPAMVKKANFARNASRWKKEYGGSMIYTINGNIKNGLNVRPKAKYGTIDKKDKDTKVGQDGLIYKRAADGEWYTDGTKHVAFKEIENSTRTSRRDIFKASGEDKLNWIGDENDKFISTSSTIPDVGRQINLKLPKPKRTYVGGYDEEEKETKKIGSLTYEKNESGKWVPASKQSTTTTRDGGRPKDFGMTRTGVNHPNGNYKYHPLTGEQISEMGIVETSEPSVKGTTKVTSKPSSTPRGGETKASASKAAAKTTTKGADVKYGTPLIEKKESLYMTGIKNNSITPLRAGMEKIKSPSSTGGGTQSKDGRWVGQYKTTNVGDWIGLGSNLAGSVASYFMTKNAINKMPEPIKPIMAQAAKLKTRYNVEPQLTEIREAEQMNRATVRRNTQSSNTSLAREQRLMNEARGARNTLYGQKENIETQLINQDRLNRQSVMRDNVRAYNEYLNKVTATKMAQNEMRASNINNLISGLTGSVNSILGNIESRRATNNTLRAIAAANPNVDARLIGGFDYYIDPITKKKYNKNQQYVGTING